MPADVDVDDLPGLPDGAVHLICELFDINCSGAWGPLTVMTGSGSEN